MTIFQTFRSAAAIAVLASLVCGGAASASTSTLTWSQTHQRQAEVNYRLANMDLRIAREVHAGELTARQARGLHRQLRFVRHEERFMAAQHGGHITRAEQRALNQQENGLSRKIGL